LEAGPRGNSRSDQTMTHYMLDLETLGNCDDGAIVTIGCVEFDPAQGRIGKEFYTRVEFDSPHFGKVEVGNVEWWLKQGEEARGELWKPGKERLEVALCLWRDFVGRQPEDDERRLWSKPPSFDERLLRQAFARCALVFPFHWRCSRDVRTLMDLREYAGVEKVARPEGRTAHNALEDAKWQAEAVCAVVQGLRRRV